MKLPAAVAKMRAPSFSGIFFLFAAFTLTAANLVFAEKPPKPLKTKNVIILVIDGPRYSETWDKTPGIIPNMSAVLQPQGTFYSNFFNDSLTYTNAGHTAITTGVWQPIDNFGAELPANSSVFQQYLKQSGKPAKAAWLISSKDKLNILANSLHPEWQDKYQPMVNCGVNGPGTGYRADSLTLIAAKKILTTDRPNLVLINFMEPDGYAHAGNWNNYLRGIANSDRYAKQLWEFLQKDKYYRKTTALIITNDHGRHSDNIAGGFIDHGDNCEGCQHISLLALGPDFKKGRIIKSRHTLLDIAPTVALLLGFNFDQAKGKVLTEMFQQKISSSPKI